MSRADFWKYNATKFEYEIDPRGLLNARREVTSNVSSAFNCWTFDYMGQRTTNWEIEVKFMAVAMRCAEMLSKSEEQQVGDANQEAWVWPVDVWLDAVVAHSLNGSPQIVAETIGDECHYWSSIAGVCKASADLCLTLEAQEIRSIQPTEASLPTKQRSNETSLKAAITKNLSALKEEAGKRLTFQDIVNFFAVEGIEVSLDSVKSHACKSAKRSRCPESSLLKIYAKLYSRSLNRSITYESICPVRAR